MHQKKSEIISGNELLVPLMLSRCLTANRSAGPAMGIERSAANLRSAAGPGLSFKIRARITCEARWKRNKLLETTVRAVSGRKASPRTGYSS